MEYLESLFGVVDCFVGCPYYSCQGRNEYCGNGVENDAFRDIAYVGLPCSHDLRAEDLDLLFND